MIDMSGSESVILAIGMKAKEYFEKRGYEIFSHYLAPPENISFLEAREMALPLLDLYTKGEIDEIQLVYTSFISSMEQQPSPNTSRRCNRISRDKYGYTQGLFVAFRGGKCSALSLAAEEERHEGEALKNGAGLLANPRQAPVLAQPNVVPAKATCGWFCAAFAIKSANLI